MTRSVTSQIIFGFSIIDNVGRDFILPRYLEKYLMLKLIFIGLIESLIVSNEIFIKGFND